MIAPHPSTAAVTTAHRAEFATRSGTGTIKQTARHQPFEVEEARRKAVQMCRAGVSVAEIGQHFRVEEKAVTRMLKAAGVSPSLHIPPRRPVLLKAEIPSVLGMTAEWKMVAEQRLVEQTATWIFQSHARADLDAARAAGLIVTCQRRDAMTGRFVLMARLVQA